MAAFVHCFQAYVLLISKHPLLLLTDSRKSFRENQLLVGETNNLSGGEYVSGSSLSTGSLKTEFAFSWFFLWDFTAHLSQFSITLAGKDGCGN